VLLLDRVAAVRGDLLDIAAMLENAEDPDVACVADLHQLLTDGCSSPLYNASVHPSELRAILYYARAALSASPAQVNRSDRQARKIGTKMLQMSGESRSGPRPLVSSDGPSAQAPAHRRQDG
jgi:hypothetical protein